MTALLRWCRSAGRAVAAVEFAIILPILLLFMGGVADFGIIYYRESCLSTAVAAAAQYASVTDESNPPVTAANIQTVMTKAAAQSMPGVAVTPTASNPALCYCITGSSPNSTLTSATCATACTSGGTAGKYVQLTLTSTYVPLVLSMINSGGITLNQTAWVPLQ
jgi:Flp pilus assembly protein TadG